jgi:sigma-B regulation protein RsbU (phosphoserine phosphatase)
MLAPAIPPYEVERLAALRTLHLLDTPPEERFDRVVRLALRVFDVPIAYVALIDSDRQWFKSQCGLDVVATPREISFCGHAILGQDTLVVPDTHLDPRFQDNPLVTDKPFLRFYAGHPLRGPGGHNIGTFCLGDRVPRDFSEPDRHALRDLAAVVERELNLLDVIRLQDDLIRAQEQAAAAERARAEALQDLLKSREHLARELADASRYVRSLLPVPLDSPIAAEWCFQPCSELGGDSFGYHWIDKEHFAAYLLDVAGHGVGSALLSVSALDRLRSGSLPEVDPRDPASVLIGLNRAFPMERHGFKFFTIWYGVYHRGERRLRCAAGGHPPATLIGPDGSATLVGRANPIIGIEETSRFEAETVVIPAGSRLFLYSDGAFEIDRPDGSMTCLGDWVDYLTTATREDNGRGLPERAYRHALEVRGEPTLADDFALVQLNFPD